jgi:hypothetical protein
VRPTDVFVGPVDLVMEVFYLFKNSILLLHRWRSSMNLFKQVPAFSRGRYAAHLFTNCVHGEEMGE